MGIKFIRIMVTGIGGDLGQAIIKSIRLMDERAIVILGCDIMSDTIGEAYVDSFYVVPHADDPEYLRVMINYCIEENVHVVVPGSEPECYALSKDRKRIESECQAIVICQEYEWYKKYHDKLSCYRALDGHIALAPYADGSNEQEIIAFLKNGIFPCVVKSRFSSGSKSVKIASDKKQLMKYVKETDQPVIQQYIDDTHGEFSMGAFSCKDFSTSIAFRRELGPMGVSWSADHFNEDIDLSEYARKTINAINLSGSCNIQVRKSKAGIRILEINPRFSSLVAARAACGFKDVEWSIDMALGRRIVPSTRGYRSMKFRRYIHEMVDFGDGYKCIREWLPDVEVIK